MKKVMADIEGEIPERSKEAFEKKRIIKDLVHISKHGCPEEFKLTSSGSVVGVTTFEDILQLLNPKGRWNIMKMIISSACATVLAFQVLTYQFLGATPDYWCQVPELSDANWTQHQIKNLAIPLENDGAIADGCNYYNYDYKKAIELGYEAVMANPDLITIGNRSMITCTSREFDTTKYKSTLAIEWDLVCERRALYSTTQAASQFGVLVGVVLFGFLMDKFGRRPIILACVGLTLITGLLAAGSPVLSIYIILRIFISFFSFGYYTGCFIFMLELLSPSQRSSVTALTSLPWLVGYMITPGIAYVIREWRYLQIAYTLPTLLFITYYWLIPESPRWLISQGRHEEAHEILLKASKINGRILPPKEALIASMRLMTPPKKERPKVGVCLQILHNLKQLLILVIKPQFRRNILICYFCWFVVSLVYYGVSFNAGNLRTDPYLYMFLGGLAEVPAKLLLWPSLAFFGRRITLTYLYVICGITVCTISVLLATQGTITFGLLIFLSVLGKMAIGNAFRTNYIFTAELFPTNYRSLAVGESSMWARVGSIMSPYINDIFGENVRWGPTTLFGGMSLIAAVLAFQLPETKDTITEEKPAVEESTDNDKIEGKVNQAFQNN